MAFCPSINKEHIPARVAFLCTVISADAVRNTAASGWRFRTHYGDDDDDDDEGDGDDLVEMHVSNGLDL